MSLTGGESAAHFKTIYMDILNTRIGRFIGLVVIIQVLIIPIYFLDVTTYLCAVISNIVTAFFCAATMKIIK